MGFAALCLALCFRDTFDCDFWKFFAVPVNTSFSFKSFKPLSIIEKEKRKKK